MAIEGGAIPEGQKLAQSVVGASLVAETLLGDHLWARGYWVASSGNVTDEVWKKYIEEQKPDESDDDFRVL